MRAPITTSTSRKLTLQKQHAAGGPGAGQDAFRAVAAHEPRRKACHRVFRPLLEASAERIGEPLDDPIEAACRHPPEPIGIEGNGERALHPRQHHEEGKPGEEQQLKLGEDVFLGVGDVIHRVGQQPVEQRGEEADEEAERREEDHRNAHVPGRLRRPEP